MTMANKKKVKAYVKKKRTPESKIIEALQSKYNTVSRYISIILCDITIQKYVKLITM